MSSTPVGRKMFLRINLLVNVIISDIRASSVLLLIHNSNLSVLLKSQESIGGTIFMLYVCILGVGVPVVRRGRGLRTGPDGHHQYRLNAQALAAAVLQQLQEPRQPGTPQTFQRYTDRDSTQCDTLIGESDKNVLYLRRHKIQS